MTFPLSHQSQRTRQALCKDSRYRERDPSVKVCTKIKLDCAYGIQEPQAVSTDVSFWYKELLPTAWYSEFQKLLSIRQFRRNGWREREFRPMIGVVSNLPSGVLLASWWNTGSSKSKSTSHWKKQKQGSSVPPLQVFHRILCFLAANILQVSYAKGYAYFAKNSGAWCAMIWWLTTS